MHLRTTLLLNAVLFAVAFGSPLHATLDERTYAAVVQSKPEIGDIVFTRIGGPIFTNVAVTTLSWTSHVGIIVDYNKGDWIVAESGVPFVRKTPLRKFLGHSVGQEFTIERLRSQPNDSQKWAMLRFADAELGKPYCLGFDLNSDHTFCSKFVHDAVYESTHQSIGEVETFDHLLHRNPDAPLWFWRVWFLGSIPWERTTITPASELQSPLLSVVIQNHP